MSSPSLNPFQYMDITRALRQAAQLKTVDHEWEAAVRPAFVWFDDEFGTALRPVIMHVAGHGSTSRYSAVAESALSHDEILSAILQAMLDPAPFSGDKRRPARIVVDDAALADAIAPALASIGVECVYRPELPSIDHLQDWFSTVLTGDSPIPGLLSIEGVDVALVTHLYELAAEFFELEPWRAYGDMEPLSIASANGRDTRYVFVMGGAGQVFGLSVHDSVDDLRAMLDPLDSFNSLLAIFDPAEMDSMETEIDSGERSWCVLIFESQLAVTDDDLDTIARHDLPVAGHNAYPIFGRTLGGTELESPRAADLRFMEIVLATINRHFVDALQSHHALPLWPIDREFDIDVVGGRDTVRLFGDSELLFGDSELLFDDD